MSRVPKVKSQNKNYYRAQRRGNNNNCKRFKLHTKIDGMVTFKRSLHGNRRKRRSGFLIFNFLFNKINMRDTTRFSILLYFTIMFKNIAL